MNTENNKIIAEFMGEKELITENQFLAMEHKAHNPTIIEYLKYDTDWNWLMEVVEKIRSIDSIAKEEFRTNLLHYQRNNKTIFDLSILEGKEYIYNACIEFIKWYNNQNSAKEN